LNWIRLWGFGGRTASGITVKEQGTMKMSRKRDDGGDSNGFERKEQKKRMTIPGVVRWYPEYDAPMSYHEMLFLLNDPIVSLRLEILSPSYPKSSASTTGYTTKHVRRSLYIDILPRYEMEGRQLHPYEI